MHSCLRTLCFVFAFATGVQSGRTLRTTAADVPIQSPNLGLTDTSDVGNTPGTLASAPRNLPAATATAEPAVKHGGPANDSWGLGLLAVCVGLPLLAIGTAVVSTGPDSEQAQSPQSLLSRLCPCIPPAEDGSPLGIQRYVRRGAGVGGSSTEGGLSGSSAQGTSSRNIMLNPLQASKGAHAQADSSAGSARRSPAKQSGPLTGKEWLEKRKAEREAAAKAAAALEGRRRSRGASMAGSHELGREQSNMQLLLARTAAAGTGSEYVPPPPVPASEDKGHAGGGKRVIGGKDVHGELTSHKDKTLLVEVREVLTNHGVDVEGFESSMAKVVDSLPKGMSNLVAAAQGHKGPVGTEGAGSTVPIGGVSDGELRIMARGYAGADELGVRDGMQHHGGWGMPPRPPPPTRASRVAAAASPRVGPPPVARERAQSNARVVFSPHSASSAADKGERRGEQHAFPVTEGGSKSKGAEAAAPKGTAASTTPSASSAASTSRAGHVSRQSAESSADSSGPVVVQPVAESQGASTTASTGTLQPSAAPPPPLGGTRTSSASGTTALASIATPPASRKGSVDSGSHLPSTPKQVLPAPTASGVVSGLAGTLTQLQAAAAGTRGSMGPPPALPAPPGTPAASMVLPPPPATPERRASLTGTTMPSVALPPTTPGRASLDRNALAAALGMPLRSATPTKPALTSSGSSGPQPVPGTASGVALLPGGLPLPGPPTTLPPPPPQAPLPPPPAM